MLRCSDIMIQKFKYLSQIKCKKTARKSYGVAGVSVGAKSDVATAPAPLTTEV